MIQSFKAKSTQDFYHGVNSREARKIPQNVSRAALRKLDMLNAAKLIQDLRIPPANKLEKLKGDLTGFYSIRINEQFRVIFRFEDGNAFDVEVIDYH